MATTFPIGARTFQTGDTLIGPSNVPLGTSGAILALDVGSIVAPQVLRFRVDYFDNVQWNESGEADFTGPWVDRQGVTHTNDALSVGFGSIPTADGTGWQPRLSQAGWQVRATVTAVNGPISTSGGSLVVQ